MPENDRLLSLLRFAVSHLYEPATLRTSPLVATLMPEGQAGDPAALRETLIQAIESLKPHPDVSAQSPAWRLYEVLHYRYVQQWSQKEVADQLGLSTRHLKRVQRRALVALADRLGAHPRLQHCPDGGTGAGGVPEDESREAPPADRELQWIEKLPLGRPVDLHAALAALRDLTQSMAERYDVRVEVAAKGPVPLISVREVVLRQILLSLLCVAIRWSAGARLVVSAQLRRGEAEIRMRGTRPRCQPDLTPEDEANLAVARRLLGICGGSLEWPVAGGGLDATLKLPAAVPVLVVDDNPDTLRLFERYATGTHYLLSGAQSPEEAFALAGERRPQVIVLDVMMPEVDGWELLGRLKEHPLTTGVPVIVCTIVAQEELAFSLGVSAFLRKPVSRQGLLAALGQVLCGAEA